MESIKFEEQNQEIGKGQGKDYFVINAHYDPRIPQAPRTFGMKLSPEELAEINETGIIWVQQWTFGNQFQPIGLQLTKPEMQYLNLENWYAEQSRLIMEREEYLKRTPNIEANDGPPASGSGEAPIED